MKALTYIKIGIGIVLVGLIIAGYLWLRGATKGDYIDFGPSSAIDVTPTQIQSMNAIGEWEFLSVSAEELVDTVRKGFFSNDELVRIYYGTLRLGVNMHQVEPGWITTSGDSITMNIEGNIFTSSPSTRFLSGERTVELGSRDLMKGLEKGLEGVAEGEECYIFFSAKYGYYDESIGIVPSMSALMFHVNVLEIKKK